MAAEFTDSSLAQGSISCYKPNEEMTNIQLYLVVGLPIIAVLTALLVNLVQVMGIKHDFAELRAEVRSEITGVREDIREVRADIKLLTGKVYELMK